MNPTVNPSPALKLITIDLDDTLWPCAPVIRNAEATLYAWLEEQAPRLTAAHDPASLRADRGALMRAQPHLAHDLTLVRRLALAERLVAFGYPQALAEAATEVFRVARNQVTPYADVVPVLTRLRERFCLISVTNGNAEVHNTPLRGLFHRSLTAAEAGAARPDPALFRLALDWAGVDATEALHLGDDPLRDIAPARALGMRSVWMNRMALDWPVDLPPPEREVDDLVALADWLEVAERS